MSVIFILSSIHGSTLSKFEFAEAHLIAHLMLYGTLFYLGYIAFGHQNYSRNLKHFSKFAALLLVILYGATDEYHQSFVPGRKEEFKNFLWDVSAAVIVLLAVSLADKIRRRKRSAEN